MLSFNPFEKSSRINYSYLASHPIYSGTVVQKNKPTISYQFNLTQKKTENLLLHFEKKKTHAYFLMTGALCFLFFSNMTLGHPQSSWLSKNLNVITSIGSLIVALGGGHFYHRHQATIDKIKLIFGTDSQREEQLIHLAKLLPEEAVIKILKNSPTLSTRKEKTI